MAKSAKPAEGDTPPADEVAPPTQETATEPAPTPVRFTSVYGFVDEHGDAWRWDAGAIVRNPLVLALLAERGAPVEPLTE